MIKIILVFIKVRYFQKFKTRKELENYQEKNLKKQIEFFRKNSPYFKNNNLDKNFFMNKEFMMENFDELNTVGVKKEEAFKIAIEGEEKRDFEKKYKNISVGLSSGTSGHRGLFITTEEEQAVWAGTVLAKMLPRGLQRHRLAFFLRANNDLYKAINSYFIKLEYFDTFEPIENHIEKLNLYKPTILIAPASMLNILAKYQREKQIKISPKKIISVAEVLEERDREYIKESFNAKIIHEIYQATEGFLACTCEHGNLHLNEDIIKFEKDYIEEHKEKKRFYPIITDFKRTSQPFINYHLNDILVENNESCKCGSVFQRIEKIEGRSDDIFKFKNK
ncbi:MAG: CoF synthetase, partial [Fusobacteriales bacterium]